MNQSPAPEARPALAPILIGFALAGALVLGLGLWAATRTGPPPGPVLTLVTPSQDTTIIGVLEVRFRTSAPLELQSTGWGVGAYHVHALVGETDLMPGAAEIRPQAANEYLWTLPPFERNARLQLVWSRANHSRVAEGASAVRQVTVP